ncbi:hypothetical protein BCY91_12140 [Pelobium manganitolerans]|uniref:Type 1 periplasmic binding fold superfamily protein n=1 Tax=Pelobium manganitolerans TaxID=1842495 RepID=A0A419S1N7_9SPHI|nr:hypothetical protein [Pelobium manganitolerans]RKD12393.1 hypothetical protein BCY91_12140 [Pelobium manganitolerans]
MKNFTYSLLLLLLAGTVLSSCSKDDDEGPKKESVYTTVSLKFTNKANASDTKTITYKDMDGSGDMLPTFSTLTLKPNAEYAVEVTEVKDDSTNPSTDLLNIIKRDSKNYLFVYKVFVANLGFSTTNYDSDNKRFGTEARANTGATSKGNFTLKLIKNPLSKENADSDGDVMFDYTFPVEVE